MTHDDQIRLVGLGGVGRHGVLDEERRQGQTFLVDVTMHTDTLAAATADDLELTVDYAAVAADVVALIEGEPVALIETLAARIADVVLARGAVRRVEVTVHKPEAPVGVPFTDVQVVIVRDAPDAPVGGEPSRGVALPAGAEALAPVVPVAAAPPDEGVPAPGAPQDAPGLAGTAAAVADRTDEPDEVDEVGQVDEPPAGPAPVDDLDETPAEPVDVVLALGGNVGDVRDTLRRAIDELGEQDGVTVLTVSPLARTAAVLQPDAVGQPDYLNVVVIATTTRSPVGLLEVTQGIEASHGRRRVERWGERTLDIDVITYGSLSSGDPRLTLPHPRANERAFVLVPWAQVQPDAFLPGLGGGPVAALAETAPDRSGVRWLALDWYDEGAARSRAAAAATPVEADPVEADPDAHPDQPEEELPAVVAVEPGPDVEADARADLEARPEDTGDGAGIEGGSVSEDTAEASRTAYGFDDDGQDDADGHDGHVDTDATDDTGDGLDGPVADDVTASAASGPPEVPAGTGPPPPAHVEQPQPSSVAQPELEHTQLQHAEPEHVEPEHVEPEHVEPEHAEPEHVEPEHVEPAPVRPVRPSDVEQTVRAEPAAPPREPWDIPAPDPDAPRLRPRWAPVNREGGED